MDALGKEEVLRLLAAARAGRKRDWLMLLVTFLHGLRVSETLAIKPDNIKDGFLRVKRLKHSQATVQPLLAHPDPLLDERQALIEFCKNQPRSRPVFGIGRKQFWRLMQRYCAMAQIPQHKAHPHALKHSIAMQLIDSAGIHRTQAWLGHKSMASTGAYLKPADSDVAAAARKALGAKE